MGLNGRNRIRFNRRRIDIRKYLKVQNFLIVAVISLIVVISTTTISGLLLAKKVAKSTVVFSNNEPEVIINENNEVVEAYNDQESTEDKSEEKQDEKVEESKKEEVAKAEKDTKKEDKTKEAEEKKNENSVKETNKQAKKDSEEINMCLLGEIMMGGEVNENVQGSYAGAFKKVYNITRDADFTYANLSTNITSLEKIENPKSIYIVTKDILNALKALGIDSVSVASDHIVDFPSDVIKNTMSMLEKDKIFVAGRENMPVYFQKGEKKIAIVSTNAVINGTASLYKKEGISTYSKENLEKNIKEAKSAADFVIADIHWGNEYQYGVTQQMKDITNIATLSGADLVIGSHALGVYPIVKYNNVPVIFSLGSFIGDSDLYLGRESYIFNLRVSKDNKIERMELIPTYIKDKKEVMLYNEYNEVKAQEVLKQYNKWNEENGLDSKIEGNKIIINF